MLDGQVEVIGDGHLEVAGGIVLGDRDPFGEGLGGREGQGVGEWIGDLAGRAEGGCGAIRIAEGPAGATAEHAWVAQRYGLVIWHPTGLAEVEEAGHTILVEDARASA